MHRLAWFSWLKSWSRGFFASFAAPFGGFLSSAIKRAYGIKDFNNLIPGHGGEVGKGFQRNARHDGSL